MRKILLAILTSVGTATSAVALDRSYCLEQLAPVDQRIASGQYPADKVAIARQVRQSAIQSCAFVDETHFAQIMEAFEELLPTRSQEEREAVREAQRAERSAEREIQRADMEARRALRDSQKPADVKLPVSDVLKSPPTASSSLARYIDREDRMKTMTVLDWDVHEGSARLLYVSNPSSDQRRLPDARYYYYVLVAGPGQEVSQHLVAEMPLDRIITAGLRGGYDEVIFQWPTAAPERDTRMERWSISAGKLLSSGTGPLFPWFSRQWSPAHHFNLTTNDGNVLFVGFTTPAKTGGNSLVWAKASPEGQVLSEGSRAVDAGTIRADKWFPTPDGGAGFIIDIDNFNEQGIATTLDEPLIAAVDGTELRGVVTSETRLLLTNADAAVAWESAALSRSIAWPALAEIGQSGDFNAAQRAVASTAEAERLHGVHDSIGNHTGGRQRPGAIAAVGNGYAALIATAGVRSSPRGFTLAEFMPDGEVRKTDLQPAMDYLRSKFTMVASAIPNQVYLFEPGSSGRNPVVVELNEDRDISGYATLKRPRGIIERVMLAYDGGVWIIGDGLDAGEQRKVWLEQVEF